MYRVLKGLLPADDGLFATITLKTKQLVAQHSQALTQTWTALMQVREFVRCCRISLGFQSVISPSSSSFSLCWKPLV